MRGGRWCPPSTTRTVPPASAACLDRRGRPGRRVQLPGAGARVCCQHDRERRLPRVALAGARGFSITASLVALGAFSLGALAGGRLGTEPGAHRGRLLAVTGTVEVRLVVASVGIAATAGDPGSGVARYVLIEVLSQHGNGRPRRRGGREMTARSNSSRAAGPDPRRSPRQRASGKGDPGLRDVTQCRLSGSRRAAGLAVLRAGGDLQLVRMMDAPPAEHAHRHRRVGFVAGSGLARAPTQPVRDQKHRREQRRRPGRQDHDRVGVLISREVDRLAQRRHRGP